MARPHGGAARGDGRSARTEVNDVNAVAIMAFGLALLAFVSGMLGLGVAFAAVPFLSFFLGDLVHEVQPLSLALNGVTALFSAIGFAQMGMVRWRAALPLAVVTTVAAPVGALRVQAVDPRLVWAVYLIAVAYLAYGLFRPTVKREGGERLRLALALAIPISILSGFLGVGPGFLLMPTLIMLGFEPKQAAGINAFAVTPPSFSSLLPHLATARVDFSLAGVLLVVGAIGSFLGARISAAYVPDQRLKQGFGVLILVVTLYRVATLVH